MGTMTNKPDDGYRVVWASAFEVGLLYNGKGLRTWWASEFDGQLPSFNHPKVREAITINDEQVLAMDGLKTTTANKPDWCAHCGRVQAEICVERDSKANFYYMFCGHCEACGPTAYNAAEALRLWQRRATEADYDY